MIADALFLCVCQDFDEQGHQSSAGCIYDKNQTRSVLQAKILLCTKYVFKNDPSSTIQSEQMVICFKPNFIC